MASTRLGPGGYPVASTSQLRTLSLQAAAGSYTITGSSANLLATHILNAAPGSYVVTGASARLIEGHKLPASPGAYSITGSAALLLHDSVLRGAAGAYAITGASANLARAGAFVLNALPGSYSITGASANLVYHSTAVKPDIDAVLTKEQLHALRRRLRREAQRGYRDLMREAGAYTELRTTLESFFEVAEPEQVEEIARQLPQTRTEIGDAGARAQEFHAHIDWPKLYDDHALMQDLTRDLGKILTQHIKRQRFEQEEDDLAILMIS